MVKPIMVERSSNIVAIGSIFMAPYMSLALSERNMLSLPPNSLPLEVCTKLWATKNKIMPQFNLYKVYEIQRDLLLTMVKVEMEEWLMHEQFQIIWTFNANFHFENLFAKVLARKDLRLLYPFSAFVVMGDVGTHVYLYYAGCK